MGGGRPCHELSQSSKAVRLPRRCLVRLYAMTRPRTSTPAQIEPDGCRRAATRWAGCAHPDERSGSFFEVRFPSEDLPWLSYKGLTRWPARLARQVDPAGM